FTVQEHNASHLHWDFRLELDGVLKSWAVPKEPPTEKGLKRLAIEVEDHDLSYANFEGDIKEGYGKGSVKIWDKGTFKLIKKTSKEIEFELKGKKLKGKYVLLKTNFGKKENGWLIFKV
ncbi:MAG: 3'-phosphoesterase, partial [Nanoarchaeota archaeon]|nr:3'-phosphoesterase [Nanoarchaeota archaeon]